MLAASWPWNISLESEFNRRLMLRNDSARAFLEAPPKDTSDSPVDLHAASSSSSTASSELPPPPPRPRRVAQPQPTTPSLPPASATPASSSSSRCGKPPPVTPGEHDSYVLYAEARHTEVQVVAGHWQVKADAAVAMNITLTRKLVDLTKKLVEAQLLVRTVKDEATRKQAESRSAARQVKELHGKDRRAWRAETEPLKSRHDADLRLAWQAEACQESERGKRQRDELARTRAQMGEAESARRAADQRAAAAEDASAEAQKDADEAAAERAAQFSAWADSTCSSPSGSTLWAARFGRRTANGARR